MKCLLVFPRMRGEGFWSPPLGVAYLAAFLEKNGIDVKIADMTFERDWTLLKNILMEFKPEVAGISIQTPMINEALEAARIIKEWNPTSIVVAGGPHVSCLPEEVAEYENIDIACFGEGEHTLLEICKGLPKKDIKGIAYRKNGGVVKNAPQAPIENLDEIPFPAWHLLSPQYFKTREGSVLTSRGCPWNCAFCQPCLRLIFGARVRRRTPKNVVDEIEILSKKYGIKFVRMQDDAFTSNLNWVNAFCDELAQRKLDIIWDCKTRANCVDKKVFAKMKSVGCYRADVGVESGSERVRNTILNKKLSEKDVVRAFKILRELKIGGLAFFMIGTPTETREDIKQSIALLKKIKPDSTVVSITTPFPKTWLYKYAVDNNLLLSDSYAHLDFWRRASIKTEIPEEELYRLKKEMEKLCMVERLKQPYKLVDTIMRLSGMYVRPKIALRRLTSLYLYRTQWRRYFVKLGAK